MPSATCITNTGFSRAGGGVGRAVSILLREMPMVEQWSGKLSIWRQPVKGGWHRSPLWNLCGRLCLGVAAVALGDRRTPNPVQCLVHPHLMSSGYRSFSRFGMIKRMVRQIRPQTSSWGQQRQTSGGCRGARRDTLMRSKTGGPTSGCRGCTTRCRGQNLDEYWDNGGFGMAKLGAENPQHQFVNTAAKFGTNSQIVAQEQA